MNRNRKNTRKKKTIADKICTVTPELTRTNLQPKLTKLYTDLKANNNANDVTKLTINDYIMLHRETNLHKNT